MKYEIIIYWSEEDQAYIASVPDLPGCMADGNSYEAALAQIQIIANEWVQTAKELGRAIPEPKTKHIPV